MGGEGWEEAVESPGWLQNFTHFTSPATKASLFTPPLHSEAQTFSPNTLEPAVHHRRGIFLIAAPSGAAVRAGVAGNSRNCAALPSSAENWKTDQLEHNPVHLACSSGDRCGCRLLNQPPFFIAFNEGLKLEGNILKLTIQAEPFGPWSLRLL